MYRFPKILKVKIMKEPSKPKYIQFIATTLLATSEIMPFLDNKENGILQSIYMISKEYTNDNF
jgi:hypothetical protein